MSGHAMLSPEAVQAIEEGFGLTRSAWRLLALVVSEWENDPMSVQCFDLRIVEEAKKIVARRRELDKHNWDRMLP